MLPDIGTVEREALEQEALDFGMEKLHESGGILPDTLYEVYEHFRSRFIKERGLLDGGMTGDAWKDALTDARRLEAHVSQCWATAIVMQYDRR